MHYACLAGTCALAFVVAACARAPVPADMGARLYATNCVGCHQANGQGVPGVYPSLAGSTVVLGDPRAMAAWIVRGQRPPVTPAGRFPTIMPQFVWFKPDELAALVTYLRSNFGNHAPAVAAADVQ